MHMQAHTHMHIMYIHMYTHMNMHMNIYVYPTRGEKGSNQILKLPSLFAA